jgi:hypothetical protein
MAAAQELRGHPYYRCCYSPLGPCVAPPRWGSPLARVRSGPRHRTGCGGVCLHDAGELIAATPNTLGKRFVGWVAGKQAHAREATLRLEDPDGSSGRWGVAVAGVVEATKALVVPLFAESS